MLLCDDQLADYQPWFDNERRLRALLAELETLSQEIAGQFLLRTRSDLALSVLAVHRRGPLPVLTERAQAELARLLEQASVGQQPESAATVGYLLDQYMAVADLDVSTREGYEGYIRRTIKPALGGMELRKLRGPVLDTFYARLRQCGDLACTGRPFTEHRNVPVLAVDPGDSRPAYRQIADTLAEMIRSGQLRVGERLPSVREMSDGGVPTASARHALALLTEEGLITSRQGSGAFVAAGGVASGSARLRPPRPDHDCAREGCQPHRCSPHRPHTT